MKKIFLFIFILGFFYSCDEKGANLGFDFIPKDDSVYYDEYNINEIYTVKIDSFTSNIRNTGFSFIGKYNDLFSGNTNAKSFLQFSPPLLKKISEPNKQVYDSIVMSISLNGTFWGDSTRQDFTIHKMKDLPIIRNEMAPVLYNTDEVELGEEIGQFGFKPTAKGQKLRIRLNDKLGKELFNKVKNQDKAINNYLSFLKYFKGLAIVPKEMNNAIVQISTSNNMSVGVYYHNGSEKGMFSIEPNTSDISFNHIKTNASTKYGFDKIKSQAEQISIQDSKIALGQGLAGYLTKIRIPNTKIISDYSTIIKAEIEIDMKKIESNKIDAPELLFMYKTDKNNVLDSKNIIGTTSSDQYGRTTTSYNYALGKKDKAGNTKYTFDVTNEINDFISSNINSVRTNILIVPGFIRVTKDQNNRETRTPDIAIDYSLNRLIIEQNPRLKIFYVKYHK